MDIERDPAGMTDSDVQEAATMIQEELRQTYLDAVVRMMSVNNKRSNNQGLLGGNYTGLTG